MKEITLARDADHRRSFAFVFEIGEDPIALLGRIAEERALASCRITGIGAFSRATLGYFDRAVKQYQRIPIDEQVEVLSFLGDIARGDDRRIVHVHCVVGLRDGTTRGGHLLDAAVWPTLEVIVTEWPRELAKRFDPALGLALIDHAA